MATSQQQRPGALASARHELPTHLQVEDRLIAGLTVRQTLLLSAGLSISYSLWRHLAGVQASIQATLAPMHLTGLTALLALVARLALAALPVAAFALLALARPADRPLEEWVVIMLRYLTLPKAFIWRSAGATERGVFPSATTRQATTPRGLTQYIGHGEEPEDDDDDDEGNEELDDDFQGQEAARSLSATRRGGLRR